jgi:hypothetical protein
MQALSLAGYVHGFTDNAPVTKLITYLSRRWFASVDIDQRKGL